MDEYLGKIFELNKEGFIEFSQGLFAFFLLIFEILLILGVLIFISLEIMYIVILIYEYFEPKFKRLKNKKIGVDK